MNGPASSVPGSGPGERLRAERERRGFSTQKVAEDLHVDVWVVEGLEAGRYESLGAPVYVKGHLRKYAVLLGLDADELVSACTEQADPPLVLLTPKARTRAPLRVPIKPLVIALVVLVFLAAAVWGYRYWRARPVSAPVPTAVVPPAASGVPETAGATVVPAETTGDAAARPKGRAVAAGAAPAQPQPVSAAQPTVRVRMSFSADSWVEVYDANRRRVFFDLGVANTARSFTLAAPARVFLGYADAVQLELDGRPVTLGEEVRRGNVAHFTIDARGRLKPAGSLTRP